MSLPPFSGLATLVVLAAGAAAIALGAAHRRPPSDPGPRPAPSSLVPWWVLGAAIAAWQVAALLQSPRDEHPTLSSLANSILDSHPARTLAFVLWLAGAWALARR